jgi:hypothetical protein
MQGKSRRIVVEAVARPVPAQRPERKRAPKPRRKRKPVIAR